MRDPRQGGRPEGRAYPHIRSMRFSDRELSRLAALAARLETTETAVIRLAIRRLAEAEGVEPATTRKKRPSQEPEAE
jgi:hypothetical protein